MKLTVATLILMLCVLFRTQGQVCAPVDAGPDMIICAGEQASLSSTPGFINYAWQPATGLSNTSVAAPVASPSVTTTYTVTATMLFSGNLVPNWDFSGGNTAFVSEYIYDPLYAVCNYHVGPDFFTTNSNWPDHTPTSDNMYMSIDGCDGHQVLWKTATPISVAPNTGYVFNFWATRAGAVQPIFEIALTGDVTGTTVFPPQPGIVPVTNDFIWDQYGNISWNSGSNQTVEISIRNLEVNGYGVDFGMDDIFFGKGCIETDSVTVTVTPSTPLDLGVDIIFCGLTDHTFSIGPGYSDVLWSDGSTGTTMTANAPGTYWVRAHRPCDGQLETDTVHIVMSPIIQPDLGPDISICEGESTTLSVSGTYTYYHWFGQNLGCNNCPATTVSPTGIPYTFSYIFLGYAPDGCYLTDTVLVNVISPPPVQLGGVIDLCAGDSVILSNDSILDNYEWSPAAGLSCTDCSSPVASPSVSTTYYLTSVNLPHCVARDGVRINVHDMPFPELGADITLCKGSSTHFPPLPGYSSYAWSPPAGLSCTGCPDPEVFPSDTTLYNVTVVTAQGCAATDSVRVMVRDLPEQVSVQVTDATCEQGGTVAVEAVNPGTEPLQYSLGKGYTTDPLLRPVAGGNYLLSVRSGDDGCPYSMAVVVGGEENAVFIPNAFSPDGNEHNNVWVMQGTCIAEIRCSIYNRWGEEIVVMTGLAATWDGTSLGSYVPDGVYSYKAEVTYISQEKEIITGFVAVIR